MFSYSGWNAAAYISEEMHDTERTVRRSLLVGTTIIIALYAVLNALYIYAVPPAERVADGADIGSVAAHALFGVGQNFLTPAIIVALLGSISAMSIAGPRVYFAMSRDGAFIPGFSRISRRFGTPGSGDFTAGPLEHRARDGWRLRSDPDVDGIHDPVVVWRRVAGLFVARRHELRSNPTLWRSMLAPAAFVIVCTAIVLNSVWVRRRLLHSVAC